MILSLLVPQTLPAFARSPGFLNLTRIDEITSDKITGALDATMSIDMRAEGFNALGKHIVADVGGDLTLVTRQNTSESSGSSFGVNAGFGFGAPDADNPTAPVSKNVSGGINQGKSNGDRAWADSTSSLVGTESVDISAGGNLGLSGSVIANIKDDGTDGGHLRISAASVSFTDLQNRDEYENRGYGFSTSTGHSLPENAPPQGTTDISLTHQGHDTQGVTRATIGQGTITVAGVNTDPAGINRDLTRIDESTSDKITGALDATMSIDNRVFTGAGWASMASDVENFGSNLIEATKGAGKGAVYSLGVLGDVLASIGETFTGTAGLDPTDLPRVIHDKVAFQQVVAELPKTCPTCVDWLAGENFDPDESKAIQKKIAETARIHGLTVNEFLIMAEGNGLYGLHNGNDGGTVVVDMLKPGGKEFSSGEDRVFTLGHEAPGHSSGGGEDYANLMGNFALGAMNLSNWLNGRERLSDSGMSATEWMSAYGNSEFIRSNNAWADFLTTQEGTKNSGFFIIEPNDLKKVELSSKLTAGRISQEEYDKQMQFLAGIEQGYDQAREEWLSRERPSILDRDFWLIPEEVLKSGDPVAIGRSEAQLSQNLVELYGGVRAIQYLLAQMQATPAKAGVDKYTRPYTPEDPLPRDSRTSLPTPSSPNPHTQLGTRQSKNGPPYRQAREFDANGRPVRDIDFTDHGRPQNHPNPHQHRYTDNPTGGAMQRGDKGLPLE